MIHKRPKNEIFASDAKAGEIVEFPNVKRGWGVTENLGFIPPMEYFNAAFNRVDKALAYQSQRGVSEWSADEEYPIGALSVFDGKLYQAKTQNTNKKPSENKDAWAVMDAYNKQESDERYAQKSDIANATETKAGITKLKNSVTGNSEDAAVSEKAVKEFASGVIQKQENGYQKLPSGLIFQWGSYPTITAGQSKDVNLPVAFPTAGVFCSANDSSDAGNLAVMLCKFKSNAQITITNDNSATTGNRNVSGQWFAVGY